MVRKESNKSAFLIVFCCGWSIGVPLGVMSGVLNEKPWVNEGSIAKGLMQSCTLFGIICGCFSGFIADRIGILKTMFVGGAIAVFSAISLAIQKNVVLVIIFRLFTGFGVGSLETLTAVYAGDMSTIKFRGMIVGMVETTFCFGVVCAYISNLVFSFVHDGWRYEFACGALPCTILCIAVFCVPEGNAFLEKKEKEQEKKKEREMVVRMRKKEGEDGEVSYWEDTRFEEGNVASLLSSSSSSAHSSSSSSSFTPSSSSPSSSFSSSSPSSFSPSQAPELSCLDESFAQTHPPYIAHSSSSTPLLLLPSPSSIYHSGYGDREGREDRHGDGEKESVVSSFRYREESTDEKNEKDEQGNAEIGLPLMRHTREEEEEEEEENGEGEDVTTTVRQRVVAAKEVAIAITSGRSDSMAVQFVRTVLRNAKMYGIGAAFAFLTQITGNLMVIGYSLEILDSAGVRGGTPVLSATVCIGVWSMLCSLLPFFLQNRVGRTVLLVVGYSVMAAGMVFLCLGLVVPIHRKYILSIAGIALHLLGYELGPGPIFWVVASELFPAEDRATALSLMAAIFQLASAVVSFAYLPLAEAVGELAVFIALAVLCVCTALFALFAVPDSQKKEKKKRKGEKGGEEEGVSVSSE